MAISILVMNVVVAFGVGCQTYRRATVLQAEDACYSEPSVCCPKDKLKYEIDLNWHVLDEFL